MPQWSVRCCCQLQATGQSVPVSVWGWPVVSIEVWVRRLMDTPEKKVQWLLVSRGWATLAPTQNLGLQSRKAHLAISSSNMSRLRAWWAVTSVRLSQVQVSPQPLPVLVKSARCQLARGCGHSPQMPRPPWPGFHPSSPGAELGAVGRQQVWSVWSLAPLLSLLSWDGDVW